MADVDYLKLMQGGAQPQDVQPDAAAQAMKIAPDAGLPPAAAAVDPKPVNDMVSMQRRSTISKTDPNMARWSAGDPMHVAASADQYPWLMKFGKTWDAIKQFAIAPTDERDPSFLSSLGAGALDIATTAFAPASLDPSAPSNNTEAAKIFNSSMDSLFSKQSQVDQAYKGSPLEAFMQENDLSFPNNWYTRNVVKGGAELALRGMGAMGAVFSPLLGVLSSVPGRQIEQQTGFRRELTGQILSMLVPLGAKGAPKFFKGKEGGPPGSPVAPVMAVAEDNAAVMDAMHQAVSGSELQARSPATMAEFIRQQTEGSPLNEVRINPRSVLDAYTTAGHAPFAEDGILGWVPDLRMKLQNAVKSGQDLTVPTAEYLTNVNEAGHTALRKGLSLGEGRSLADAEAVEKTTPEPVAPQEGEPPLQLAAPEVEAAVAKVKAEQYLSPLFKTAADAGMTEPQFAAYSKRIQAADEAFYAKAQELVQKQIERERSTEWTTRGEAIAPEVRAALSQNPTIAARHFLSTGEDISGRGLEPVKLDRAATTEAYPALVDELPASSFGKNGIDADSLAEAFGFNNGEQMLRSIADLERVRKVAEETGGKKLSVRTHLDQMLQQAVHGRLLDELGNHLTPEGIEAVVREATHEPAVQNLLIHDLKEIARQWIEVDPEGHARFGNLPLTKEAIRARAEESFGDLRTVDAANVRRMESYIGRNGREAEMALMKKDYAGAFAAKQKQLLNNHMLQMAHEFQKIFTKGIARFKKVAGTAVNKGIDQSYMDRVHDILRQMTFPVARSELELSEALGKQSTHEFILDQQAAGQPIVFEGIPARHPKGMTVNEFLSARATIDSMMAIGRTLKTFDRLGKRLDARDVLNALSAQRQRIGDRFTLEDIKGKELRRLYASDLASTDAAKEWLADTGEAIKSLSGKGVRSFDAQMKSMEFLFDQLDGFNSKTGEGFKGVFNEVVMRRLQERKHWEDDTRAQLAQKVTDHYKGLPKSWNRWIDQKIDAGLKWIDPDGQSVTIIDTNKQLLRAAMHWGTAENRWKLAKGYGLPEEAFQAVFDKYMTKDAWNHVQFMWDLTEPLFKESQEMYRRMNGVPPMKVESLGFDTQFGSMRGGHAPVYYSVKYGPAVGRVGAEAMYSDKFQRALPSHSYTYKRTGYTAPVELDYDLFQSRINQMIHDVAYREALLDSERFLRHPEVQLTIAKMVGPEYARMTKTWLQHIAQAFDIDDQGLSFWNQAVSSIRRRAVIVGIGYRVKTLLKHGVSAALKSVDEIGTQDLYNGYAIMKRQGVSQALAAARERSGELRRRQINVDQQFREELFNVYKKQGWLSKFQHNMGILVQTSDQFTAYPTFLGAEARALARGMTPEDAIAYGDKAVRRAHGASSVIDVPTVLSSQNPILRLGCMFMTFMNNGYNRVTRLTGNLREGVKFTRSGDYGAASKEFGQALAVTARNLFGIAFIDMLIEGEVKKDVGETAVNFIHQVERVFAAGLPYGGALVDAMNKGREFEPSPAFRAVDTVLQSKGAMERLLGSERMHDRDLQHLFEAGGLLTDLPTGQAGQTAQFLWNWHDGREHPKNVIDLGQGLAFGTAKEKK